MSIESLTYKLNELAINPNRLLVYYDFNKQNVLSNGTGSNYQAYIKNLSNTGNSGFYHASVVGATGTTISLSLSSVTGLNEFLENDKADFTKKIVKISGSSDINLSRCSYLMVIDSELSDDGVIIGSFSKNTQTINGIEYTYSSGFNYGQTYRGQDFLKSQNINGEYCFVKNEDDPTKRRIVGITFNNSDATLHRFDYVNNIINSQSFSCSPLDIQKTSNFYLGSAIDYFRGAEGDKLFSGKLENFLILSGYVFEDNLYEIGKSLISEYQFNSGSVLTTGILSGFETQIIYKTGVTGSYLQITGYYNTQSGIPRYTQIPIFTGLISAKEGERITVNYTDYIENIGYLDPANSNYYSPTGIDAQSTLGLQNSSGSVSGFAISGSFDYQNTPIPLYETIYLTGVTSEVSGVINTPIYVTGYITGSSSSGISFSDDLSGFQKNLIYYLGDR
jgi:hypothetical protein